MATLVLLEEHFPGELGHKSQAYSCMCILGHVMTTFELRKESEVRVSWEQTSSYFSQDSELYLHRDPTVLSRGAGIWVNQYVWSKEEAWRCHRKVPTNH